MTTGDLLLRAILKDPADDIVRLAYADWLEENGDHDRATATRFRLPFDLPGMNLGAGDVLNVEISLPRELMGGSPFHTRVRLWELPVAVRNFACSGTGAFVERVELPAAAFTAEVARAIFSAHPVTEVVLTDVPVRSIDTTTYFSGQRSMWTTGDWTGGGVAPWRRLNASNPAVRSNFFSSKSRAEEVQARMCADWGRGLVGLPAIE